MRRRLLLGAAALASVLVAVAAWASWPRGTTEITEQEALDDFREHTTATSSDTGGDEPPASSALPEAGVYLYRATGQEEVKLGPLPAETRQFPESVTSTVADAGNGCFDLTVNLFEEHTEMTRYCTDAGTLTLAAHTKHQRIGALSPTAEVVCDPALLLAPDRVAHDLSCTLVLSGGPAAISATLLGSATRAAAEELTVGTDVVQATPLTIAYQVTGDLSGSWTETLWLNDANLPLRIERSLDLTGPATFAEQSRLDLESLTPTT